MLESAGGVGHDTNAHAVSIVAGASGALYLDASGAAIASGNAGSLTAQGFTLGFAPGIGASIAATYVEAAFFSGAHTAAQVSRMFAYFAAKYGQSWS